MLFYYQMEGEIIDSGKAVQYKEDGFIEGDSYTEATKKIEGYYGDELLSLNIELVGSNWIMVEGEDAEGNQLRQHLLQLKEYIQKHNVW